MDALTHTQKKQTTGITRVVSLCRSYPPFHPKIVKLSFFIATRGAGYSYLTSFVCVVVCRRVVVAVILDGTLVVPGDACYDRGSSLFFCGFLNLGA